jgi:hypothetical protein
VDAAIISRVEKLYKRGIKKAQKTLLVRGFAHRGFAYSLKNYCGNI